ncbi:hypothetical protein D3C77_677710 [compost metagenome]
MAFAGRKLLYVAGVTADGLEVEPIKLGFGEGRILPDTFKQPFPVIYVEQRFGRLGEQEALGDGSGSELCRLAFLNFQPPAFHRMTCCSFGRSFCLFG